MTTLATVAGQGPKLAARDLDVASGAASTASALVIGLSIHGLAVVRALHGAGVTVYGLEQNVALPACRTRFARVFNREGVNSDALPDLLLELRSEIPGGAPIALFPTSDNMVRAIALGWGRLREHYRVSWSGCIERILELQRKDGIERHCRSAGVEHPRSVVLSSVDDARSAAGELRFPAVVKPVKPLSSFKVARVESADELLATVEGYAHDLPHVAQEWIAGPDDSLVFCTMYLDDGRELCAFTGRKVRSVPPGMGMGTVVESTDDPQALAIARRFVAGLGLSGPVAIEFKVGGDGRYWLIEPNVGRTEYSVDLIVQSGLNLPLVELGHVLGRDLGGAAAVRRETVWFDTERDPFGPARTCWESRSVHPRGRRAVFPFLGHDDPAPFWAAVAARARWLLGAVARRMRRVGGRTTDVRLDRHDGLDELPADALAWLERQARQCPFTALDWFRVYERVIPLEGGTRRWYCVRLADGALVAVWPFVERADGEGGTLEYLANYYTPYVALTGPGPSGREIDACRDALRILLAERDRIVIFPMAPDDPLVRALGAASAGALTATVVDLYTVNWRQQIESFEAYMGARHGRLRSTLRRRSNALRQRSEVEICILEGGEDLDRRLDDYFRVYARSWKRDEAYPDFVADLATAAARKGWLRLGVLYADGQPAAAQIWFVKDGTASIFKLAYDEAFSEWSVGTQLTAALIERAVHRDGVTLIDYLTGDDGYKRDWMDSARPLYTVEVINWRRPRGFARLLRTLLGRVLDAIGRPSFWPSSRLAGGVSSLGPMPRRVTIR